ncbi:Maf family protein [Baekduia alba]|uniref:Maf family protein n=1 Tax=Baekduia alba TaxID=2997333 RepID=UPI00233FD483|nr:Maf family protein [Baekduia alba]
MSRLVLASGSPQRRAILDDLGLAFEVRASDVAEEDEGAPRVVASENALRKALAVAATAPDDVVLGCDTLVATELEIADHSSGSAGSEIADHSSGSAGSEIADHSSGSAGSEIADHSSGSAGSEIADHSSGSAGSEIWGKPANADAARETLKHLSGRTHQVVSGLALVQAGDVRAATEVTAVTFRDLDDATIDWYVSTGEWEGRAGGYAIQGRGAVLVKRIVGDYLNVVGLPVGALLDLWPSLTRDFRARP